MPFVKIDCGMLESTIWDDHEARILFLTALLMADLRKFENPIPQIHVRRLEATGWEAPPGWYGFVPAAGVGIIKRAGGIANEDGMAALERLGDADPESRSQDNGGRRMIRVDGGYLVLNYEKYRERDYTSAKRARDYRNRKKVEAVTRDGVTVTRDDTSPSRDVTEKAARVTHSRAQSAECRVQSAEPPGVEERERLLPRTRGQAEKPMTWQAYTARAHAISQWQKGQPVAQSEESFAAAFEAEFQIAWETWGWIKGQMEDAIPESCRDGNHFFEGSSRCIYCPYISAGEEST